MEFIDNMEKVFLSFKNKLRDMCTQEFQSLKNELPSRYYEESNHDLSSHYQRITHIFIQNLKPKLQQKIDQTLSANLHSFQRRFHHPEDQQQEQIWSIISTDSLAHFQRRDEVQEDPFQLALRLVDKLNNDQQIILLQISKPWQQYNRIETVQTLNFYREQLRQKCRTITALEKINRQNQLFKKICGQLQNHNKSLVKENNGLTAKLQEQKGINMRRCHIIQRMMRMLRHRDTIIKLVLDISMHISFNERQRYSLLENHLFQN